MGWDQHQLLFFSVTRYHPARFTEWLSFRGFQMWPSLRVSSGAWKGTRVCPALWPLDGFVPLPTVSSLFFTTSALDLLRTSFSCHTLELSDQLVASVITGKEMAFSRYCRSVQNVWLQFGSAVMLIIPKYVNYRLRHTNHINRYSLCLSLGVSWFLLPLPMGFLPIHLPTIMSIWKGFCCINLPRVQSSCWSFPVPYFSLTVFLSSVLLLCCFD